MAPRYSRVHLSALMLWGAAAFTPTRACEAPPSAARVGGTDASLVWSMGGGKPGWGGSSVTLRSAAGGCVLEWSDVMSVSARTEPATPDRLEASTAVPCTEAEPIFSAAITLAEDLGPVPERVSGGDMILSTLRLQWTTPAGPKAAEIPTKDAALTERSTEIRTALDAILRARMPSASPRWRADWVEVLGPAHLEHARIGTTP